MTISCFDHFVPLSFSPFRSFDLFGFSTFLGFRPFDLFRTGNIVASTSELGNFLASPPPFARPDKKCHQVKKRRKASSLSAANLVWRSFYSNLESIHTYELDTINALNNSRLYDKVLILVIYLLFLENRILHKKMHPFFNENFIFIKHYVKMRLFSININQNWKQIDQN